VDAVSEAEYRRTRLYAGTFGPTPEMSTEEMLALTIGSNRPAHSAMKDQLC
jgi:hypothetical protein